MTDLAEIMQKTIKSIAADQAIVNAARRMRDERIGSLLVEENDNYVGILTETDIVRTTLTCGCRRKRSFNAFCQEIDDATACEHRIN